SAFMGLGGTIASFVARVLPIFSNFKLLFIAGLKNLGATIGAFVQHFPLWASMIIAQLKIVATNWIAKVAQIGSVLLRFVGGPIGLVVSAVVALAIVIINNWDAIKSATISIFGAIGNFLSTTWSNIKTWISTNVSNIVSNVREGWANMKSNISTFMSEIYTGITTTLNNIKTFFSTTTSNIVSTVRTKFSDLVSAVKGKMDETLNTVQNIGNSIINFFDGIDLFESGKAIIQS